MYLYIPSTAMKFLLITISLGLLAGCDHTVTRSQRNFKTNYPKAVVSGYKLIEEAQQMESLFCEVDHFVSSNGQWNSEAFFADRYVLTMQVDVKVSADFDEVLAIKGDPEFHLREIETVQILDDGRVHTTFAKIEGTFGLAEWKRVVDAGGDFSKIGIKVTLHRPVKSFERYVHGVRRDRVKVALPAVKNVEPK